jgi:hypothetical protein
MASFLEVKSRLGLERECMHASRTGGNNGYGAPVEKRIGENTFWLKVFSNVETLVTPSILFYKSFIWF